jgi:broad specificity phosphatase PhoE
MVEITRALAPTSKSSGELVQTMRPNVAELYLVRHGTTTWNITNRYRGRRDVPLDTQGWADAKAAAGLLAPLGLSAAYAGPLQRCIDTARVIADECGLPDVRVEPGLVNLDYGTWEGMTAAEAAAHDREMFARYVAAPLDAVCPNGERLLDAQERIVEALRSIGRQHQGERVAGVTHAVMIRLLAAKLVNRRGAEWRIPVGRGSLTKLEVENGEIRLLKEPDGDDVD